MGKQTWGIVPLPAFPPSTLPPIHHSSLPAFPHSSVPAFRPNDFAVPNFVTLYLQSAMTHILLIILTALLCGFGLLLSALAFSGTWMVLLAALITQLVRDVPTLGTLVIFALLCITGEVLEAFAGFLGVRKRGGSRLAGFTALIGGLVGAGVGTGVVPIIGTILGMLLGSFGAVFLTEWLRLRHHGQAAHIAWGTVWARLAVLFLKTALTLGMSLWLIGSLLHS